MVLNFDRFFQDLCSPSIAKLPNKVSLINMLLNCGVKAQLVTLDFLRTATPTSMIQFCFSVSLTPVITKAYVSISDVYYSFQIAAVSVTTAWGEKKLVTMGTVRHNKKRVHSWTLVAKDKLVSLSYKYDPKYCSNVKF